MVGAEREAVRERLVEGRGDVGRVEAQEGVERHGGGGGAREELPHAVEEAADDVVEIAGDDTVGDVADAVAAKARVRDQQLIRLARGWDGANANTKLLIKVKSF